MRIALGEREEPSAVVRVGDQKKGEEKGEKGGKEKDKKEKRNKRRKYGQSLHLKNVIIKCSLRTCKTENEVKISLFIFHFSTFAFRSDNQ